MGRFYKTSYDTPIDYMYRINSPLMAQVLASNDAGITESLAENDKLDAAKNFQHIAGADDAIAQQEQQKIQDQVNTISKNIQGDYANWKKQLNPLRTFKQSVMDNYATGTISKLQGNYNTMKANFDDIDKQVALYNKTGGVDKNGNPIGINPIKAQLAKQYALNNYNGAIDQKTGAFTPFKPIGLMNDLNLDKTIGDAVSKIKADKNDTEISRINGAYFNDTTQQWEGVSPDKILSVAMNRVTEDPAIMDNLRQSQQIGYIRNAFNSDGSFRMPFTSVSNNQITPQEQAQIDVEQHRINTLKSKNPAQAEQAQNALNENIKAIGSRTKLSWDSGSFLAPYFQSALDKYSGTTTTNKQKLRNNSYANEVYGQGQQNYRQTRDLQDKDTRQQQTFAQQKVIAQLNHDYKMDEITARGSAAASKLKGGKDVDGIDKPTIIGKALATPFAFMGNNPNDVTASLNNRVMENGKDIMALYRDRDAATASGDIDNANHLVNQINSKLSEQMNLNQRDSNAKEDAVNSVVPKSDQGLYANKEQIKQDYINYLKSNKSQNSNYLNSSMFGETRKNTDKGNIGGKVNIHNIHATDYPKIDEYNKVMNYEKAVDIKYKDNLLKATKEITNGATEIGTTKANNDFIRQAITANPSEFKIVNSNGETVANLQDGKTDINKDFKIIGAGPSNGLGDGTMNIYATDKKGNNVIIVPTPNSANIVREYLINDWNKNGDEGTKQLTKTWSSPYFNAVNGTLNNLIVRDNNPNGVGEAHITEIGLPTGQAQIRITKIGTEGYKVELDTDKSWQPLPNPNGDYFTSNADIVDQLDKFSAAVQESQKNK